MNFIPTTYCISERPNVKYSWYLFVLSISTYFKAFGGTQLNGGATDHLDAALSVFCTWRPHTTVHLKKNSLN